MNDTSSTPSTTPIPNNYGVATSMADVQNQINEMEAFFETGATLPVDFRLRQLRRLQAYLLAHEQEALDALHADLGKSAFESYATELGLVYDEIRLYLRKLRQWARPRHVPTPLAHFPSSSTVYPYPFGVAAVLSPWNYPVQLALVPLVDAIGAGNCVAMKPSKTSPHTSQFLRDMCRELFDPRYVYCWHGSNDMNDWLLQVEFDKIMFTGSPRVGREIMTAAAQNLTSVTLELGGKSPVVVDKTADVKLAARRIAFGKVLNAGQTCVAPDYVLATSDVIEPLAGKIAEAVTRFFGSDLQHSDSFGRIINARHFDRLTALLPDPKSPATGRTVCGGNTRRDDLYIAPTVLLGVKPDAPVMQEEIFGPILPILEVADAKAAVEFINARPRPLAAYAFTGSKRVRRMFEREVSCGALGFNLPLGHLISSRLPFGGVGASGMGSYHGKAGFLEFSHVKTVVGKPAVPDTLSLVYPPYDGLKKILIPAVSHTPRVR